MNKKMTKVIGIVAVLALVAVAFVGAGAATDPVEHNVNICYEKYYEETITLTRSVDSPAGISWDVSGTGISIMEVSDDKMSCDVEGITANSSGTARVIENGGPSLENWYIHVYAADDAVAKNCTTQIKYYTLKNALDQAEKGERITLLKNVELTEDLTINEGYILEVPQGVTLTIGDGATLNVAGTLDTYNFESVTNTNNKINLTSNSSVYGVNNVDPSNIDSCVDTFKQKVGTVKKSSRLRANPGSGTESYRKLWFVTADSETAGTFDTFLDGDGSDADHAWYVGYPDYSAVKIYTYDVNSFYVDGSGKMLDFGIAVPSQYSPWYNLSKYDFYLGINVTSGVDNIGDYLCYGMDNMKNYHFTESTFTSIGDGAFASIGDGAFAGTDSYAFTVPSCVTRIGANAFNDCRYLKTVTFEENSHLEYIGWYAFYNCSILTEVTLPVSTKDGYKFICWRDINGNYVTSTNKSNTFALEVEWGNPTVSQDSVNIAVGKQLTLSISGEYVPTKWTSSDSGIVTVSSDSPYTTATITGVGEGTATVSAVGTAAVYSCEVTVFGENIVAVNLSRNPTGKYTNPSNAIHYTSNGETVEYIQNITIDDPIFGKSYMESNTTLYVPYGRTLTFNKEFTVPVNGTLKAYNVGCLESVNKINLDSGSTLVIVNASDLTPEQLLSELKSRISVALKGAVLKVESTKDTPGYWWIISENSTGTGEFVVSERMVLSPLENEGSTTVVGIDKPVSYTFTIPESVTLGSQVVSTNFTITVITPMAVEDGGHHNDIIMKLTESENNLNVVNVNSASELAKYYIKVGQNGTVYGDIPTSGIEIAKVEDTEKAKKNVLVYFGGDNTCSTGVTVDKAGTYKDTLTFTVSSVAHT